MSDAPKALPCPYKGLPDSAYWRRSVAETPAAEIDPVTRASFTLGEGDAIATAGSCFAQHIARFIRNSGGNYFVTEPGHPILAERILREYNYGTFSARFGNIYTVRQLRQLFERTYGMRRPVDDVWRGEGDALIDPFRPFIQPGGFLSVAEYDADRRAHFAAVRRMIEQAKVFVFTLGLTEAWVNTADGSVYAACPGCGAGEHVEGVSRFHNFDVIEVIEDLAWSIDFMRARNPGLKVLLTVSPVPLIATYSDSHVLAATTYSKSVLRVAAEAMVGRFEGVDYFPSHEIITSAFSRGAYYAADLREVEERGVRHAMRTFFHHYCPDMKLPAKAKAPAPAAAPTPEQPISLSTQLNDIICDEQRLEDEF